MKKFFALMAVAFLGVMGLNAQTEAEQTTIDDGITKKWEFRFDGAYGTNFLEEINDTYGASKFEESTKVNVGVGYNFTENWYLGLGSGYSHNMGGKKNHYIPLLGDVTYRWNGKGGKWSFFVEGRGGYMLSVTDDQKLKTGENYTTPNGWMFDAQPGVYYRLKSNLDLKFSVGYMHFNPNNDTPDKMHCINALLVKLGMNIRKAPKMIARTEIEEAVAEPVAAPEPVVEPAPEPVKIVETTTPEQKQLGQREVVIYYNIRMHNILPEKDALLQEMAEFVKTHKTGMVVLKSYADKGTGNYQLNQMYSRNRMNEVKKHLIEKYGIPADKIDASYYGDTIQPFEENDLNRCSIITVFEVE